MHIEKRLKEGHSADHERDWQPYPVDPSLLYRRYFQHAHFITIVGVGKRGEY